MTRARVYGIAGRAAAAGARARIFRIAGRSTSTASARARVFGIAGRASNFAITVTAPATAEAYQRVRFTCDSTSSVSSWSFSFNQGSHGGTLALTKIGTDDVTNGVAVREFEAPAVPGVEGDVSIRVVAHALGGDQVANVVVHVYPPVEYIRRNGAWLPRRPLQLIRR